MYTNAYVIQRDFQEIVPWEHDEHGEDDIEDYIRSEMKIVNDCASRDVSRVSP